MVFSILKASTELKFSHLSINVFSWLFQSNDEMRRDDWGTRNRPTINATVTEVKKVQGHNYSDIPVGDPLSNDKYNISNNKTEASGDFFGSYDPEVGVNTAAVLGGLLSFLVLYVIYRTNCRKRLTRAFNTCAMKYFPEEFEEIQHKASFKERKSIQDIESKSLERTKSLKAKSHLSNMTRECFSKTSEHGSDINGNSDEVCCGGDYDELDHIYCDNNAWLPEMEEDIERATAEWVQNVQDLDPADKQLSSIILKIPPDLLTCPYRFREKIHSVSEYCNTDGLSNISQMNQSLPLLINNERGVISPYANAKVVGNCVSRSYDYSPVASQEDLDNRPKQLEVKHQSGDKVPLDICPIIKIHHYHSRSKRRLTSLNGGSSDDSSSSDPSFVPLLSVANADLMNVYQPYKHDNISVSRNSLNATNNRPANITGGLETSL